MRKREQGRKAKGAGDGPANQSMTPFADRGDERILQLPVRLRNSRNSHNDPSSRSDAGQPCFSQIRSLPFVALLVPVALFLVLNLTAIPTKALAQGVSKVGTTAADFLQIGVGARATAMGGAMVATTNDAASLYWNPAGLSQMTGSEVIATHSEWLADVNFDYVGVTLNLGDAGSIGVSVTMLAVPEMLVRSEDRQEGTGETFDAADMAIGISYGRAVTDRFSVGANVKYIQQRIWHSSATGFAIDFGTQFKTDFFGGLTIGAAVYNFGSGMRLSGRDLRIFTDPDPIGLGNNDRIPANYELDSHDLPLNFQFGVSMMPVNTRMHQVTLSVDALHPSSNYESVNVGFEYGFQDRFFLRGGFESLFLAETEGGLSGGAGVKQQLFSGSLVKLDYAYRTVGRLGGVHVIGLGIGF